MPWTVPIEHDGSYFDGIITDQTTIGLFVFSRCCTLIPQKMGPLCCCPTVLTKASKGAIFIPEDSSEWILIFDAFCHRVIKEQIFCGNRSRSLICRGCMPAMRAISKCSCIVKVEIVKFGTLNSEPLWTRSNDSMGTCVEDFTFNAIGWFTNNKTTNDLCVLIQRYKLGLWELHTCQDIICNLEVVELNSASSLCDCSISVILIREKVVELSNDRRIVSEREWDAIFIDRESLAWLFTWNQLMENSEPISSIWVGNVVPEFTKFGILRADTWIERRTNWIDLKIEPVTIAIGTGSMIISEDIIWVSDPERCRCLIRI